MLSRGRRRPIRVVAKARVLVALALLALAFVCHGAVDVDKLPQPSGYLSDLANVVDPPQKEQLEDFCTKVEQQLGVQFALVTVDSLGDRPIRDIGLQIFRKWGVGDRKTNQGVLLLLAVKDRQSDIETGRGIEPYIVDGFAGSTLRSMRPDLRSGNYGQALLKAARAMAAQIAQGKNIAFFDAGPPPPVIEDAPQRPAVRGRGIPFPLIVLGIFLLLWLFGRGRGGGYRGGGGGGGFLTGILLGNLLGGGRGGGFGGGGWGGGGGFGGGGSGGGGFGGFGGGDAGGGGASSNW